MAKIVGLPSAADPPPPAPQEVRAELERLIADPEMKASARRRDFLRFIVEETLAGRAEQLKGVTVAQAVFGRDASFDQHAYPVVRIEARRLRRDLDCHYIDAGRDAAVRISVPVGGYVPHFERQRGAPAAFAREPKPPAPEAAPARRAPRPRWALAVLAGLALLAAALAAAFWPRQAQAPGVAMAVLPFEAFADRADAGDLAGGLGPQLVTDLMRFPGLRLYAAPSAAAGLGAADAGRALGVDYVVSGSVAADDGSVRIGTQLVDVATSRVLWSKAYDVALSPQDLVAAQTDIAAAIASELGQPYGVVQSDFARRLADGAAATMPSYACVLRAQAYRRSFEPALYAPTLACLEAAVARDPDYAEAWALLGWLRMDGVRFGFAPAEDPGRLSDGAVAAASHALALDPDSSTALKALSSINYYAGRHAEAERLQRQALALNPNDPDTMAQLGWRLAARGEWDEGIGYLRKAIARTVNPPGWYYHLIAVDSYRRGELAAMLDAARRSTADGSGISWSLLAIAQAALGDREAAGESLEEMARRAPRLAADPAAVYRGHQLLEPTVEQLVAGLRAAGLPASAPAR
jgi:TolB-like protein